MEIYNFSIIAHIDHGKSTLADRMLELTGTVTKREMKNQLLDTMDLEREKGITIKLQPVRMEWQNKVLNLIDTPGHVDFQYEVSRSLQAVEGCILLVDATQGVQAQTVANLYLAIEQGLVIIPVINKIDLPAADADKVKQEIVELIGCKEEDILSISAKTGVGVEAVLDAVIKYVPTVKIDKEKPFRALIFDSVYDDYKGVVAYVRVVEGKIKARDNIVFLATGANDYVVEAGTFAPSWQVKEELSAGEIGYIATGLKDVRQARVGDTITLNDFKTEVEPLSGFEIPQPKIFAGVYPSSGEDFPLLKEAVNQLQLNDASLTVTQERSEALGQGFRCGFLGMLHLEIVQERLKREYEMDVVVTTPSVVFKVKTTDGREVEILTPAQFPDPSQIEATQEQYAKVDILTPTEYVGAVFELMQDREAALDNQHHFNDGRVQLSYNMPLRELVVDLYDQLKSATSGYGSLSYDLADWRSADVVKLTILINHETVEALSVIVSRSKAEGIGKRIVSKLKNELPKQLFVIPIQAAIGGTIVARETISALRKDVTGGLYGGDYSRKRKLLEKQKKGKKRLAGHGKVDIPSQVYLSVLKR